MTHPLTLLCIVRAFRLSFGLLTKVSVSTCAMDLWLRSTSPTTLMPFVSVLFYHLLTCYVIPSLLTFPCYGSVLACPVGGLCIYFCISRCGSDWTMVRLRHCSQFSVVCIERSATSTNITLPRGKYATVRSRRYGPAVPDWNLVPIHTTPHRHHLIVDSSYIRRRR